MNSPTLKYSEFEEELLEYCDNNDIDYPSLAASKKLYAEYIGDMYMYDDVGHWVEENEIIFKDYEPMKSKVSPPSTPKTTSNNNLSFGSIWVTTQSTPVTVVSDWNIPKKEVENTMKVKTDETVKRDYLCGRINDLRYTKRADLQEVFNLYKDSRPRTYKELIEYIKEGKYTLDENRTKVIDANAENEDFYNDPFDGIKFTARPSSDWEGFNAAMKDYEKEQQKAKDAVMSGDYDKGLAAIQALEAWTPEGKSN